MRLASPGQIAAIDHHGNVEASADKFHWMAIKQIDPGVRIRMGVLESLPPGPFNEIPEEIARDIYAAVFEK